MNEFGRHRQWVGMLLLPLVWSSEAPYKAGKAKLYEMPDGLGTPSGACGYGEYGRSVYNGSVATVSSSSLYRAGVGCGACYQVKCMASECSRGGVQVVVTDGTSSADEAHFILSSHAFAEMGKSGNPATLREKGVVDILYKRVQCKYGGQGRGLMVRLLEQSTYPDYLAFLFLFQGGTSPISAVEVFEKDSVEWKACRRLYGAVWYISGPHYKAVLGRRIFVHARLDSPAQRHP